MKKRAPRNYDGTAVPAKTIHELLPQFLLEISKKNGGIGPEIAKEWFANLGEKMGPMTEIVSFEEGILTVKVKSSTLYSLLCQHEKPRLLRLLQKKFSIRDIKLKIG